MLCYFPSAFTDFILHHYFLLMQILSRRPITSDRDLLHRLHLDMSVYIELPFFENKLNQGFIASRIVSVVPVCFQPDESDPWNRIQAALNLLSVHCLTEEYISHWKHLEFDFWRSCVQLLSVSQLRYIKKYVSIKKENNNQIVHKYQIDHCFTLHSLIPACFSCFFRCPSHMRLTEMHVNASVYAETQCSIKRPVFASMSASIFMASLAL